MSFIEVFVALSLFQKFLSRDKCGTLLGSVSLCTPFGTKSLKAIINPYKSQGYGFVGWVLALCVWGPPQIPRLEKTKQAKKKIIDSY